MSNSLKRLYVKGGIISPSELLEICNYIKGQGNNWFMLGSRQDILIEAPEDTDLDLLKNSNIEVVDFKQNTNIVTSYVAADIFDSNFWVNGATFMYILFAFDFVPKIKISITDPNQVLVPNYASQLNFLATKKQDYWHVCLKHDDHLESVFLPVAIHSSDIPKLTKKVEEHWGKFSDVEDFFDLITDEDAFDTIVVDQVPSRSLKMFPYYEGMHRYGIDKFWLGLYWRNNKYSVDFLKSLCEECFRDEIGIISITAWKSIIIKDLPKKSKTLWERMLGTNGISVRHSQLEMNWHLPAGDLDALDIKKYIVDTLDKEDISTYGLTLGIYDNTDNLFTSIAIVKTLTSAGTIVFSVYHADKFNPENNIYIKYAQNISQIHLPLMLLEMARMFFKDYLLSSDDKEKKRPKKLNTKSKTISVHQCKKCENVYDERLGEVGQAVLQGTRFEDLPSSFYCGLCEAAKNQFVPVVLEEGELINWNNLKKAIDLNYI